MAVLFSGKCPQVDELSSITSSSCDVGSLQLAVEGGRLFKFDHSALSGRVVEEVDLTEEDEDDKDGIRFATLESQFKKQGNSLKFVNHKSAFKP